MEAIKTRRSVRNYSGKTLREEDNVKLFKWINDEQNLVGPFENSIRIVYKEVAEVNKSEKIGTYGFIKNAPSYLICICKNNKENLLDLGCVFENLVLFLEGLRIGTCWIGGTFNRKKLQLEQDLAEKEFIPIISPVGYAEDNLHLFEKLIRKVAKSDNRKNFDELFFNTDFNTKISDTSIKKILEYVKYAPSASNKQPWRVLVCDNQIAHFYIERTPRYGNTLGYDIQMVDMGIALSHYMIISGKNHVFKEKPDIEILNENYSYVLSVD